MLNINNYKIITTKKDLQEIVTKGCIICKKNHFSYYNNSLLYKCDNCNSIYTTDIIGVMNMLETNSGIIRVYNKEISLIDDEKKDFEVEYKSKLVKRKSKTSQR